MSKTRRINRYQQSLYENYEKSSVDFYLSVYETVLAAIASCEKGRRLQILDIGGASGHFVMALKDYFNDDCDVCVIDNTRYESWEEFGKDANFIEASAFDLYKIFTPDTFDLVFANRFFHHLVSDSYNGTMNGFNVLLSQIKQILKDTGKLCILDHYYDGLIIDNSTSYLIYMLTSRTNPLIRSICKKMGAKSAGVGVCYQSAKMWENLLTAAGFKIETKIEKEPEKMTLIKRVALLSKNYRHDNVLVSALNRLK